MGEEPEKEIGTKWTKDQPGKRETNEKKCDCDEKKVNKKIMEGIIFIKSCYG